MTRPTRAIGDVILFFDPLARRTAAIIEIDYTFRSIAKVCDDETIWGKIRPHATPLLRSLTAKHFNSEPDRRNRDSKQSVFWTAFQRIATTDALFPTETRLCMEISGQNQCYSVLDA